jgi:hypothetical protein
MPNQTLICGQYLHGRTSGRLWHDVYLKKAKGRACGVVVLDGELHAFDGTMVEKFDPLPAETGGQWEEG